MLKKLQHKITYFGFQILCHLNSTLHFTFKGKKIAGGLVQWLKLSACKVGDRGFSFSL